MKWINLEKKELTKKIKFTKYTQYDCTIDELAIFLSI